jgi:acyl-coenzyme A synthetase/AMP-(fatty) acid ligase
MSHGTGPHCFGILTLGGSVVIVDAFDAATIVTAIERFRITDIWLPPTALYLILELPNLRSRDFSSLRHVWLSTMAVSPSTLKQGVEVLGPCLIPVYGQIESGFITALGRRTTAAAAAGDRPERLLSVGQSLFMNRVAIMSDDGALLPPGTQGEIVVRGQCVKRYLTPDATAAARRFGWHHTDDIGYFDDDGLLYIVGRVRDVINVAGFKIPAAQIESAIRELPSVHDVAVISVPDPVRGEVPKALVVLRAGSTLTIQEVRSHCLARLTAKHVPAAVAIWDDLPKTPAGKIDKSTIRRMTLLDGISH